MSSRAAPVDQGLVPPSAQGVMLETQDPAPRWDPCMEPASPSACVSASLYVCHKKKVNSLEFPHQLQNFLAKTSFIFPSFPSLSPVFKSNFWGHLGGPSQL